jgi:predicted PurR-regulated permease PerM
MSGAAHPRDLTRTVFAVLFLAVLIGGSLWVMRPFLGPAIWAVTVVVATWGLMRRVQRVLWGRRFLAVTVMTLALLLLLVVPLTAALVTIADNADLLAGWAKLAAEYQLPERPPAWLVGLPVVGDMLAGVWERLTALGVRDLLPRLSPYAGDLTKWFLAQVGGLGTVVFQFLVTVAIAGVLYATGEEAAALARRFARRLAGERGDSVVVLAGGAIRGVALGVGVTAVVQAVLAGLGMWAAGVPFAGLLTAVAFMLCIAQVGPLPVLLGAAVWAFATGSTGWGIALLVWSALVGTLDNVLRPMLIKMGADLPFLLIFAGVIGGLLSFGLVGIFVGPVVLAVSWTLLESWMTDGEAGSRQQPEP